MSRSTLVCRRPTVRRITAMALTLLLLIQTTGCVSWQPKTYPIPSLQNAKPTDRFRITLDGVQVFDLTQVRMHDDSIFGMAASVTKDRGSVRDTLIPVSFPWAHVSRVERRHTDVVGAPGVIACIFGSIMLIGSSMDLGAGMSFGGRQ